jgi:hypothetical protein
MEAKETLAKYREIRAKNNPTGMGCVHLNSNRVKIGDRTLAEFPSKREARKALIDTGFQEGMDGVFYVGK